LTKLQLVQEQIELQRNSIAANETDVASALQAEFVQVASRHAERCGISYEVGVPATVLCSAGT
jgi:hypothetical protein